MPRFLLLIILLQNIALAQDRLTTHTTPKPLSPNATTSDWPRFLGPTHNLASPETRLLHDWGEDGPTLLWEVTKGEGYASPIIQGERLLLFHRLDGHERIECRHPETGQPLWEHSYPVEYQDRYGYQNGPRGSPVIDGDKIYTLGVTGQLTCLNLEDGKLLWGRDLASEMTLHSSFFGTGSTPLVYHEQLIVMVGAQGGPCVIGLDKMTGKQLWGSEEFWGASYASPQPMGDKVLVYCGGESRPPHGGLLALDADDKGKILGRFPWRGNVYESVNASTPAVLPDGRAFISECYGAGSIMLQLGPEGFTELWRSEKFDVHWMTPVTDKENKTLFLIDGRHQQTARLVAVDADTGQELWSESLDWQDTVDGRPYNLGIQRASLLQVDGDTLCLGELGSLLWLDLDREGVEVKARHQLFLAPQTWTPPALSRGLLYIMQNGPGDGTKPRLLCYDLCRP